MKLLSFSKDSFRLKVFGHYFQKDKEVFSEFIVDTLTISRKIVYKVLVHAKPPIREGLSIYQVYKGPPDFEKDKFGCAYCFDVNENNLFGHDLIADWEIQKFDFDRQQIILGEGPERGIQRLDIPPEGMPVVLTLNGEVIYSFWFMNEKSSFNCDRVYAYPKSGFVLQFGSPGSNAFGADPRFDERLKKYLETKK